jgi:hypothetical protein
MTLRFWARGGLAHIVELWVWDWVYSLQAHATALWHALRGHQVTWVSGCIDLWTGHLGCLLCEACPDTSLDEKGRHVGLAIWARSNLTVWWVMQRICARQGHRELRHPKRGGLMGQWVYVHDKWYCARCLADVDAPPVLM